MKTDPTLEPKWKLYRVKDVKKLKAEIATLKTSLSKVGEMIEELKKENKLHKAQLRKFGKIFDDFNNSKKTKGERDHGK